MADLKKSLPLLSQEELDSLSAWHGPRPGRGAAPAAGPAPDLAVDRGFHWRMLFLLLVVGSYAVKLLVFPDIAASNYDPAGRSPEALAFYLHQRGWFLVIGACVYLYAYLRDWHFEKVAIGFFAASVATLLMDYLNVYQFMKEAPTQAMWALIALRLAGIFCLFLNAARADRAPPMPRRLWG